MYGISKQTLIRFHKRFGLPAHRDAYGGIRFIPFEVLCWLLKFEKVRETIGNTKDISKGKANGITSAHYREQMMAKRYG
jgi:hypothetical protein